MGKKIIIVAAVAMAAILLAGCDASATKQSTPDPVDSQIRKAPAKEVIGMPDGFRNVAVACDGAGNAVYVTSRGSDFAGGQNGGGLASGIFVVPKDARCMK